MACKGGTCGINRNQPPPAPAPAVQPAQFGNLAGVGVQPNGQPITPQIMNQPGQAPVGPRAVPFEQQNDNRGWWKRNFGETPAQVLEFPRYDQQQQQTLNGLLQLIGPEIQQLIQQRSNPQTMPSFDFAPIEALARQDFTQKTVPSIAERFTSLGGGQRSSAFGQQLGAEGANLETSLAGLRAGHSLDVARLGLNQEGQSIQQQDLRQRLLLHLLGLGLGQKSEYAYQPRIAGPAENIGKAVGNTALKVLPALAGAYLGGPAGAVAGGAVGNGLAGFSPNFFQT